MMDYGQRSLNDWVGDSKLRNVYRFYHPYGRVPSSPSGLPPTLTSKQCITGRAMSVREAQSFALMVVKQLPSGYSFTLKGLFPQLVLRGDQRGRSAILHPLRNRGMIVCVGLSRDGQESRHDGVAHKWMVTPRSRWEE